MIALGVITLILRQASASCTGRLQEILQQDPSEPIRGIRTDDDNIISLNSFIYSLIGVTVDSRENV
ncbi:hypothetical protein NP493_2320g00005 [Ridgeia piscesae]|uniref:Uncharacterized protein n=1 Tax=Ridgeia piscesae TaxID=27915 RepID=A0AAD9JI32_RIDPI|nr:hypothetical protein NP493_2320g00005 [Ridgeia piscesae]